MNVSVALSPEAPSATRASPTDSDGASSSSIVPVPVASVIVAPDSFDRVTVKVSFGSSTSSPVTVTVKVLLSSPVLNVRLPLPAV